MRRRTVVLGAGLALALALAACGTAPEEPSGPGPTGPTTAAPAAAEAAGLDLVEEERPFPPGGWSGVRTTADGLLVAIVGAAPAEPGDACTAHYAASAEETDAEVRVRIRVLVPRSDGPYGCTHEGYARAVPVALERPLGDRAVLDATSGGTHPVFDGAGLLEPGWLPEGWAPMGQGASYPDVASARYWERRWGLPQPRSPADPCPTGTSWVALVQGPADLVDRLPAAQEPQTGTAVVRGRGARVSSGGPTGMVTLAWTEGDQGFALSSATACTTSGPVDLTVLERVADGLR